MNLEKYKCILILVVLSLSNVINIFSKEIYPGKSYSLEPEFAVASNVSPSDSKMGGGIIYGLTFRDLRPQSRFGFQIGYNYLRDGNKILPLPSIAFRAGYGYLIKGLYSFWPTLELSYFMPPSSGSFTINYGIATGAAFDFHLFHRNYLSLEPMVFFPLNGEVNPYLRFRVGVKYNFPILRKLPRPAITLNLNTTIITPDNDGLNDILQISPQCTNPDSFKKWRIQVLDKQNNIYKSWSGTNAPMKNFIWDGTSPSGTKILSASELKIVAEAEDLLGNRLFDQKIFSIYIPPASIKIDIEPDMVNPLRNQNNSLLNMKIDTENPNSAASWKIEIIDPSGFLITSWSGLDFPPNKINWNGQNGKGKAVLHPGNYEIRATLKDLAGDSTTNSSYFNIIIPKASIDLTISPLLYNPYDDKGQLLEIAIEAQEADSVEWWKIFIEDKNGVTQKTWFGDGAPPASILWNGINNEKKLLNAGSEYYLFFEFKDIFDNESSTRYTFETDIPTAFLTLSVKPQIFSPDNDGINDILDIEIQSQHTESIKNWKILITDEKGNEIFIKDGKNGPPTHTFWDGINDQGVLVPSASDFTVTLEIENIKGQKSRLSEEFTTDVFVYNDNGKKKIRVPGILFPPNSADFSLLTKEEIQKNREIIARIAEVLQKFPEYKIIIEGHGNLINWLDPELSSWEQQQELIPLSKERADAVRRILISDGVSSERLYTIGSGGAYPIVPFHNVKGRWINRRVEFILLK